jgi:chromosome segregation ATPase
MNYEDDTLIRLRRQYSKDETVAALSKKLSEADVKNGMLQSEIDELKHDLSKVNSKNLKLQKEIETVNDSFEDTTLYQNQKGKIKNYKENVKVQKNVINKLKYDLAQYTYYEN